MPTPQLYTNYPLTLLPNSVESSKIENRLVLPPLPPPFYSPFILLFVAFLWEREKGGGKGREHCLPLPPHPSSRRCNSIKRRCRDNTVLEKLIFYLLFIIFLMVENYTYGRRCNSIEEQMLKERMHALKFVEDTYL